MTPDELKTKGQLLYGENWRTCLARNLGITRQNLRLMLIGEIGIREKHQNKINELLITRSKLIRATLTNSGIPKDRILCETAK
jgi:hypothetical protein